MNEDKPTFKSSIPEHLLADLAPKDKYIMEHLSIIMQQQSWQVDKLEDLDERVKFANSKTSKAITDIEFLKNKNLEYSEVQEDIKDIVNKKRFADKYVFNKKFLIIFSIFCLGVLKIILSPHALEWFNQFMS